MSKSWLEKLNSDKQPIVKILEKDFADMKAGQTMFIATPLIIDGYIRAIAKGQCKDVKTLRKELAQQNHADVTCPVTLLF